MEKFLKIIKKLYWLGLIGIVGSVFNQPFLQLFYLFFLFAILDVVLSFIIIIKSKDNKNKAGEIANLKFLFQNLGMLIGIPVIYIKYRFCLPSLENYHPQNEYILPFQGCWLTVNGGVNKADSHSWTICGQRYAYDFYIEKDGLSHKGDGTSLQDYYCYEQPILCPADGIVVQIKNLFNDTPVTGRAEINCTASDVRGNYIIIKHSGNEFSTIAHIKKDSFSVKTGDHVVQGQTIAACGNSGNTSEPHIHFQANQGKSFLFDAGIPIRFGSIINHTNSSANHYITRGQLVENTN